MSRSTNPFVKKTLTVMAVGAIAVASIVYIQEFAKIDPLVNMGKRNAVAPELQGVSLRSVHLVSYRGDKKATEANVEKVFIPSNRSQYRMEGIKKGTYFSAEGKQVHFSAPKANWDTVSRVFQADNSARIWNKDMDIKTALFRINENQQTLYAPGDVTGRFFDGKVKSTNLLYDIKKKVATVGPTHWDGNLALTLQDGKPQGRKKWQFDSDGGKFGTDDGKRFWTKGIATDGEIIVKADRIEHDEKTDIVVATGNVQYFSSSANLKCDKVVAYRKEKRAVLTGNVDMLVKPKDKQQEKVKIEEIPPFRPTVPPAIAKERPAAPPVQDPNLDDDVQNPKTLRNYPIAITANQIEYWYGKGNKHAIVTGNPFAQQQLPEERWRKVRSYRALYDGEKEVLTLEATPGKADIRMWNSVGDDFVAEKVVVSTAEGVDKLDADGAKGTYYGKDDDDGDVGIKPPDPIKPKKGGGGLQGPIKGKSSFRYKAPSNLPKIGY